MSKPTTIDEMIAVLQKKTPLCYLELSYAEGKQIADLLRAGQDMNEFLRGEGFDDQAEAWDAALGRGDV